MTSRCAQTRQQLLAQLAERGDAEAEIRRVGDAYELAAPLCVGLYRPSGKTHLDHCVGVASILAGLGSPADAVAAGLLHSIYVYGDFGLGGLLWLRAKRRRLARALGEGVERRVWSFTQYDWSARQRRALVERIRAGGRLDAAEREVVTMRLANQLEDHVDLGILYCPDAEQRCRFLRQVGPVSVEIARGIGETALAEALEQAFERTLAAEVPPELRCTGPRRVYRVVPRSHRRRRGAELLERVARVRDRLVGARPRPALVVRSAGGDAQPASAS